jgi:hypothetical protein
MHELLDEVVARPMLARSNYSRRMHLKTDWSITGMAGVLFQVDPENEDVKAVEEEEEADGTCLFNGAIK